MRLKVAEAYVKVLTGARGNGSGEENPSNRQLGLTAVVNGLGPVFQLVIQVRECRERASCQRQERD